MSVATVNEGLAALRAAGTSVWLDQLRRGMIDSGELEQMVREDSFCGVTSNPAIFEKAILDSTGRFHKGGPETGVFLQLVDDGTDDLDIPEESYSFRELMDAQADGDLETLRAHGLTAVRIRVPADDPAKAINELRGSLR
jgi:hypothetical protein